MLLLLLLCSCYVRFLLLRICGRIVNCNLRTFVSFNYRARLYFRYEFRSIRLKDKFSEMDFQK